VGEDRSLNGDRAELRPVDPGLHGALTAHGRADPLFARRQANLHLPEAGDRCHSEPAQGGLADEVVGEVVQLVGLEAAGVADVGEDRDAVGDGNADSDVALRVLGDAGHPEVYAVVQRVGACCKRTE
jgi:hypothetical protein